METGAVVVGSGSQTLDTYIDFMCPICNKFEETYGDEILDLVNNGTITLNIHPIAILDRYSQGTAFSTRAANAMYCVAENDPDEQQKRLRYNDMVASSVILQNTVDMMRILEYGEKVRMVPTECRSWSVDTPEDLARVRALFHP